MPSLPRQQQLRRPDPPAGWLLSSPLARRRRCLALVRRIARELGISRPVRLIEHAGLTTPATFGVRRPVVLFPTVAREWPGERLSAVLYHELAHVQRLDYASLLLLELVRAFYWVNPLVLAAARKRLRGRVRRSSPPARTGAA